MCRDSRAFGFRELIARLVRATRLERHCTRPADFDLGARDSAPAKRPAAGKPRADDLWASQVPGNAGPDGPHFRDHAAGRIDAELTVGGGTNSRVRARTQQLSCLLPEAQQFTNRLTGTFRLVLLHFQLRPLRQLRVVPLKGPGCSSWALSHRSSALTGVLQKQPRQWCSCLRPKEARRPLALRRPDPRNS